MVSNAQRYWSHLKPLLINRYSIFIAFLLSYTGILQHFGGLPSFREAWHLEIPLLLYLYYYLNLILRPFRLKPLVAAAPIVLLYLGFDLYYILFGRMPQIIELAELPEMFVVFPLPLSLLIGILIGLPVLAFLASIQFRKAHALVLGALPFVILVLNVEIAPESFMEGFKETQGEIVFYSDVHSTRYNGRIGMTLYNEARRKSYLTKIDQYRGNSVCRQEFNKEVCKVKEQPDKRNVHMIVLESFLDPTLMKGAKFSRPPADPSFEELFHGKGGLSISPVFGGATAQAEFEALCGVPAMRELSGVEFNVFSGAKTFCLPNILTQGGYETTSTNSFVPDFFNATNAYTGMGFEKIYYPSEYAVGRETYFSRGDVTDEMYIFDGDLLSQNLEFISQRLKKNPDQPLFNYILGIYGHTPHEINTDKRPEVVTMQSKFKDDQLGRSANQYYFRTKAIATFVKGLIKIDPQSLIILVSDHLPPLSYGPNTYRDFNYLGMGGSEGSIYLNRILIVENGQAIQYNTIHHFDIPRIVLNYVTRGQYCQEHACDFKSDNEIAIDKTVFRDEYMAIMAQAMGCESPPPVTSKKEDPVSGAATRLPHPPAGV